MKDYHDKRGKKYTFRSRSSRNLGLVTLGQFLSLGSRSRKRVSKIFFNWKNRWFQCEMWLPRRILFQIIYNFKIKIPSQSIFNKKKNDIQNYLKIFNNKKIWVLRRKLQSHSCKRWNKIKLMIFSVWMATKVQDSNCFSRLFDQNSFLFRDHPKIIYKFQTTSPNIMTSNNSWCLCHLEGHKHFYLKGIPKFRVSPIWSSTNGSGHGFCPIFHIFENLVFISVSYEISPRKTEILKW